METETITITANKPFNGNAEYKSHKKQTKKARKKKRPANSLSLMLAREKANKNIKRIGRNFDVAKERDSLLQDMNKYLQYATGRVVNLTMLKDMIVANHDTSKEMNNKDAETITKITSLLEVYQKNIQEVKTSMDICGRLTDKLKIDDALEATAHLSGELVEIMSAAEELERETSEVVEPYKEDLKKYMIEMFSNPINASQAEDILDVDNNADEELVNEEVSNGSETEKTEEPAGI